MIQHANWDFIIPDGYVSRAVVNQLTVTWDEADADSVLAFIGTGLTVEVTTTTGGVYDLISTDMVWNDELNDEMFVGERVNLDWEGTGDLVQIPLGLIANIHVH